MRVLIVFHGRLPGGPHPVPGIALRAHALGDGLRAHGVEVYYASRRRDLEDIPSPNVPTVLPFEGHGELLALAQAVQPDAVIAVGVDEVQALRTLARPIILDLFAPRLLEAQWEGQDPSHETLRWIDALARADYFLVTTARARYLTLGVLPLAGVDCRTDRLLTVPLSIPVESGPRDISPTPLLVAGGVAWPWQDPTWALEQTSRAMKAFPDAHLTLLRGPYPLHVAGREVAPLPLEPSDQVEVAGLLPYPDMLTLFQRAWCAIDLMAPNLEREVALSFRQLDALRCGLPLLIGEHAPLAPLISDFDAGWVVRHGDEAGLQDALEHILRDKKGIERRARNVKRLARKHFFAPDTVLPLLNALRNLSRRTGLEPLPAMLSRRATEAHAQEEMLAKAQEKLARQAEDLFKKDTEINALRAQIETLTMSVGRLSLTLEQQAWQHTDDQQQLNTLDHQARLARLDLARAHATLERDLQKKTEACQTLLAQREALESDLNRLHEAEQQARARGDRLSADLTTVRARLTGAEEALQALKLELQMQHQTDAQKQEALAQSWAQRDTLRAEVQDLQTRLEMAAQQQRVQAAQHEVILAETRARAEETLETLRRQADQRLEAERSRFQTELDAQNHWIQREREALEQARATLDARLSEVQSRHQAEKLAQQAWLEKEQQSRLADVEQRREALEAQVQALREELQYARRGLHQLLELGPVRPVHDRLLNLLRGRNF